MEWSDDGIVISVRRYGEQGIIASLLTSDHGRHAGLCRGTSAQRGGGGLQPGTLVRAQWRSRVAENLGAYKCDIVAPVSPAILADGRRLSGLAAACVLVERAVPERQSHVQVYKGVLALLEVMETSDAWPVAYVHWELGLLGALGFGLDLSRCAVTGQSSGLGYVSPRSGRAVTHEVGEPYRDKLLTLPAFLTGDARLPADHDIAAGLKLTGLFLERCVFGAQNRPLPEARGRFAEYFTRLD